MRLFKYLEFILESRLDVQCPVIFSKSFVKKCKIIDSEISLTILDMDRKLSPYTFISDSDDGESIQYTESYRIVEKLNDRYGKTKDFDYVRYMKFMGCPEPDSQFWSENRVDIKIGRFVRKFLSNQFSDSEIEEFVNKFKSLKNDDTTFEFWSGSQIVNSYKTRNYENSGEGGYNPLFNSCMNDELTLLDFYLYIKDLQVIVLLNSEKKIIGRALLWKDTEGRMIMDRVYYVYDADYYKFINLAKKEGWFYKKRNISGGSSWLLNGVEQQLESKVAFPSDAVYHLQDEYNGQPQFPYLDSFYYLDDKNWFLSNYEPNSSFYILNGTSGDFEYYSNLFDVHGNRIGNEDEYEYSKTQGGLVSLYNAYRVHYDGFDDYIEDSYLKDPKNGFIYDEKNDNWYKKEDFEKMNSSK